MANLAKHTIGKLLNNYLLISRFGTPCVLYKVMPLRKLRHNTVVTPSNGSKMKRHDIIEANSFIYIVIELRSRLTF